jgi:hypothetical protein
MQQKRPISITPPHITHNKQKREGEWGGRAVKRSKKSSSLPPLHHSHMPPALTLPKLPLPTTFNSSKSSTVSLVLNVAPRAFSPAALGAAATPPAPAPPAAAGPAPGRAGDAAGGGAEDAALATFMAVLWSLSTPPSIIAFAMPIPMAALAVPPPPVLPALLLLMPLLLSAEEGVALACKGEGD